MWLSAVSASSMPSEGEGLAARSGWDEIKVREVSSLADWRGTAAVVLNSM